MQTGWLYEHGLVTNEAQAHSPVYDFVKDIVLPAVPLAGMFLSWNSPWRFWAFLIVAVFFGTLGLYPRLKVWLHKRAEHLRDQEVAMRDFPKFRQFVRRFGEFVDNTVNTTLLYVVTNDLSPDARTEVLKCLGIPTIGFWYERWYFFLQRVNRSAPTLAELVALIPEFHCVVGEFNTYCMTPIFQRLPKEVRDKLTDDDKSKLNGFVLRHMHYIAEYEAFAKELSESRPSLQRLPWCFLRFNPL